MKQVESGMERERQYLLGNSLLVIILALSSWGLSDSAWAASPDEEYGKAAQKYQEGHLPEAYLLLLDNLKTNPEHAPSLVLIAKVLYRLEKFQESAKYFEKVDLKQLDADTAFEYGVAMYGAKRCDDAIRAFIDVPKSHHYQSYARFYSGACYLQKGQYNKALIKLRKAVGLPPMLNAMRRNLIAVARTQIELQSTNNSVSQTGTAIATTTPAKSPERAQKQSQGAAQSQKAPASPLTVDVTPSVELKYSEVQNNYHNYKFEYWAGTSSTENVAMNSKYELAPVNKAPNPYLSLLLNAKRFDQEAVMPTTTLNHDNTTGIYSYSDSKPKQPYIQTDEYTAAPALTLPFSTKSSMTATYEYWYRDSTDPNLSLHESHRAAIGTLHSNFAALDIDSDVGINYTEHQGVANTTDEYDTTYSLGLAKNFKVVDIHVYGSYLARKLPAGVAYTTSGVADAKAGANATIPIEKFSLFGGVEYLQLIPADGQVYVDQTKNEKTDFTLSLERPFDMGLTLKAIGGYEVFSDLVYKNIPMGDVDADPNTAQKGLGIASGTMTSASASASQSLFGVLTLTAYIKYTDSQYVQPPAADLAAAFYKETPDQVNEWGVTLGLKKTF